MICKNRHKKSYGEFTMKTKLETKEVREQAAKSEVAEKVEATEKVEARDTTTEYLINMVKRDVSRVKSVKKNGDLVVVAAFAGYSKDDLSIEVVPEQGSAQGWPSMLQQKDDVDVIKVTTSDGRKIRLDTFNTNIFDRDNIECTMKDGLLVITVPRSGCKRATNPIVIQ
jgi:HSP20 family molecular chaperone IbpA